jgi:hypothetical protein
MAAAIIMNTNSFPVALLRVLVVSMLGLKRGQDDTVDAIIGRALTRLLLCGTMERFVSSFHARSSRSKPRTIRRSTGVTVFSYLSKAATSDDSKHTTGPDDDVIGSLTG